MSGGEPNGVPAEYLDAVIAAAEIVGRSGGKEFEIGWLYDDEEPPPGWPEGVIVPIEEQQWYATARYKGALLKGEGTHPALAAERLAARVLHGGQCVRCKQSVNLVPEQGQWSTGNCNWRRVGKHWVRGCDGDWRPLHETRGQVGFLWPTVFQKSLCPRCAQDLPDRTPARSQVKYGEIRTIFICDHCGMEEYVEKQTGVAHAPDTAWPVVRNDRGELKVSDDFRVELSEKGVTLNGAMDSADLAKVMRLEGAKGHTPDEILNNVLKEGVKGMEEIYRET
jgi:hypothetical protein